jgi:Protein of unknown function (DUF3370)
MLPFLMPWVLAQSLPPTTPVPDPPALEPPVSQYVIEEHPVRLLPGQLDKIPVFNSNSPEVVKNEGILLSTLQPGNQRNFPVHLNYSFNGRFDVFTHHIARPEPPTVDPAVPIAKAQNRRMNLGILVYNPGTTAVRLDVLQALSYTTKDDAPFNSLPDYVDNAQGRFFSGPGSRLATDILRGESEPTTFMVIPPGQSQVLFQRPIPTGSARSGLMRLRSNGKLQVASIALFDKLEAPPVNPWAIGHITNVPATNPRPEFQTPVAPLLAKYRSPNNEEWQTALSNLPLATPRDMTPSTPGHFGSLVYGRVAGVAEGNRWEAFITDQPNATFLSIPDRQRAFSYVLNTPDSGTLGTGQVQTGRLFVRYPDTAHDNHGNYSTYYRLTMPLQNNTGAEQAVIIKMQTPLKDQFARDTLRFSSQPENKIFFRGTVRITYPGEQGEPITRQIHIVQRRGERGQPLVVLRLPAGTQKLVEMDLIYPPDATPPQVVTIESIDPAVSPIPPADQVQPLIEVTTP